MLARPLADVINWINRVSPNGGFILRVQDWRHHYPSWTQDISSTVVVKTVHGFDVLCDATDFVGRHIIADKDWEPLLGQTIQACLSEGGLAVDVGTNIGFNTLRMAQCVGRTGRVIAFEPDLRNLGMLLESIRINRAHQVVPVNLALSDQPGMVRMALQSGINFGLSNIRESTADESGQPVLVVRAD